MRGGSTRPVPAARRSIGGAQGAEDLRAACLAVAMSSRRLPEPLAAVIRSQCESGKPLLMDAVLRMVPEGSRLKLTALVGEEG